MGEAADFIHTVGGGACTCHHHDASLALTGVEVEQVQLGVGLPVVPIQLRGGASAVALTGDLQRGTRDRRGVGWGGHDAG